MANNTINHLLRLSVCALAIAGLAGCGGGGGGGGAGSGGGSASNGGENGGGGEDGGNGGTPAPVRPSCLVASGSTVRTSSPYYNFWFPDVQLEQKSDKWVAEVTLVDADDFASQSTLEALGNAYQNQKGEVIYAANSAVVARTGHYIPPAGGEPAVVQNLYPSALVYVGVEGNVHRLNLEAEDPISDSTLLTDDKSIQTICAASIITGSFDGIDSDYYLYSVPAAGSSECDWETPANNTAYRVQLGGASSQQAIEVPSATPIATLADSEHGTLQAIIALDKDGDLNVYDSDYANEETNVLSGVTQVRDLYHTVDTAWLEAIVNKSDSSLEHWLVRIESTTSGPSKSKVLLDTTTIVRASTADNDSFYYALQTSSGYAIYKTPLLGPFTEPTKLYEVKDKPGTLVSVLTSTDRAAGQGRLVLHEIAGTSAATGRLLWIGKGSDSTTPVVAHPLDSDVLKNPPFVAADGYLYYTVLDSSGNTEVKLMSLDSDSVIAQYDRSLWLTSTLPADRPSGVAVPQYVLLAAGYTGSYPSVQGAELDTFSTDGSTVGSCMTFLRIQSQNYVKLGFDKPGFGAIGTGYTKDSSDNVASHFAFDGSDGRFELIPPKAN